MSLCDHIVLFPPTYLVARIDKRIFLFTPYHSAFI